MVRALIVSLLLLAGAGTARAESNLPPALRGVGFDQKLNEQVPLDLAFKDETGREVRLADYFRDRPVILNLAYFRCPMLCDQVMNGLVQAMLDLPLEPGKDFRILTVSFDPRETPEMAAAKRQTYLQRYGRPGAEEGWHFLTGQEEAIKRLTAAVGFRYTYDPKNDQFAHASGIVVLTPAGKVSRYFYDIRYSPRDLRLGLVEASANRIGSAVDQVLLFCFHYDPREGKYGPAVLTFVRAGGVLTIIGVGVFVAVLVRGPAAKATSRERERRNPTSGVSDAG
jgi:protein SCO1/2